MVYLLNIFSSDGGKASGGRAFDGGGKCPIPPPLDAATDYHLSLKQFSMVFGSKFREKGPKH